MSLQLEDLSVLQVWGYISYGTLGLILVLLILLIWRWGEKILMSNIIEFVKIFLKKRTRKRINDKSSYNEGGGGSISHVNAPNIIGTNLNSVISRVIQLVFDWINKIIFLGILIASILTLIKLTISDTQIYSTVMTLIIIGISSWTTPSVFKMWDEIQLLTDKGFKLGDLINVQGKRGVVVKIGLKNFMICHDKKISSNLSRRIFTTIPYGVLASSSVSIEKSIIKEGEISISIDNEVIEDDIPDENYGELMVKKKTR